MKLKKILFSFILMLSIFSLFGCKNKSNEIYEVTEKEFNEAVDLSTCNNFKATNSITNSSETYIVTVERFNDKIRNGWGPDESSLTHSYQSTSDIEPSSYYILTVKLNGSMDQVQYKDLKYDKSLSCYVGEIDGYNWKVKFLNKKLKSIEVESINPEKIDYRKKTYEYDCVEDFEIPQE